jgi:hypothetical protein
MAPDIDLILCARDLLLQLPVNVNIMKEWVKGHYTRNDRKVKYYLNDLADKLAVAHNSTKRSLHTLPPVPSPLSGVELLFGQSIITS